MEFRTLEIEVISAKVLGDVKLFTNTDTYAVVSISDDPQTMLKTTVDRGGGTDPTWNSLMKFTVNLSEAQLCRLTLMFQIRCKDSHGEKVIGEVHVPVKVLIDAVGDKKSPIQVVADVLETSGKPKGVLNFSYAFSEKFSNAAAVMPSVGYSVPVVRPSFPYAPPPPASTWPCPPPIGGHPPLVVGYGYHPPPHGVYPVTPTLGYGYPPMPGYPYPLQPVYGYPQVRQPAKLYGLGFGAGILGQVHTGMLMSDMLSDAAGYVGGSNDWFGDVGDT